jgi:hypothetical protein
MYVEEMYLEDMQWVHLLQPRTTDFSRDSSMQIAETGEKYRHVRITLILIVDNHHK